MAFAHRDLHLHGMTRRGATRRFMNTEIKKYYLRVLVADVDDACATVVVGASDRCEKAPARPRTWLRKDGGREERCRYDGGRGGAGECKDWEWEARIRVIVSG